ncbi:MAG: DUF2103 domain-containing protein [Desulfitobacteriaceae bacterium]
MKYRKNKVKREHGIIEDALLWLEELGRQPEVTDIIPGVIEVSRSPERGMVYKYETHTGCKLLLKSNGSVQETFVVTKNPAAVREWVESNFPPGPKDPRPDAGTRARKTSESRPGTEGKSAAVGAKGFATDKKIAKASKESGGKSRSQKKSGSHNSSWNLDDKHNLPVTDYGLTLGDLDSPNLGEMLKPTIRQKLRALQKNLPSKKKI